MRRVRQWHAGHVVILLWLLIASASGIWFWIIEPFTEAGQTRRIVERSGALSDLQMERRERLEEFCTDPVPAVHEIAPKIGFVGWITEAWRGFAAGDGQLQPSALVCSRMRVDFWRPPGLRRHAVR